MLRRYKISTRIAFLLVFMVVFIIVFTIVFFYGFNKVKQLTITDAQELMLEGQKEKIKIGTHTLSVAISSLLHSGMNESEKIDIIQQAIDELRFETDKSGYYFVYKGTEVIAHGTNKNLIGTDTRNLRDPNGVYIIREMADVAAKGGGFTRYVYDKPGKGDQPKIGYSEMLPGTDYWIGTGIYIDNIETEKELIRHSFTAMINRLLIILGITIGVLLFIIVLPLSLAIRKSITDPLKTVVDLTHRVAVGDLSVSFKDKYNDEVSEMIHALNLLVNNLEKVAGFATEIGNGHYDTEFTPLSDKDKLGSALLEMRKSLIEAKEEEEKRNIEDKRRNWITQGVAKFGEILRHNAEIEQLADDIIINLVNYLDANQGALFILNDEQNTDYYEQKAMYAYSKSHFFKKKFALGEGLVGSCAQENRLIYIDEMEDEHFEISSGIGKGKPRNVLIVPLSIENNVLGVLELASFKVFEKYQVKFIETIAESIAITLSTVKMNNKTNTLLEKSQEQTERLEAQEQQMRTNIEQMQEKQEELEVNNKELTKNLENCEEKRVELEKQNNERIKRIDKLEKVLQRNSISIPD